LKDGKSAMPKDIVSELGAGKRGHPKIEAKKKSGKTKKTVSFHSCLPLLQDHDSKLES